MTDDDATQMMGRNGANVCASAFALCSSPAATSISGEVGTASKGTALTELIGSFMAAASAKAQTAWLESTPERSLSLRLRSQQGFDGATGLQAARINSRSQHSLPNATVQLTPTRTRSSSPPLDPSIATAVTVGGVTNDVARQGHGVQRAVMISMFQAMVLDVEYTSGTHEIEDGEDKAAS